MFRHQGQHGLPGALQTSCRGKRTAFQSPLGILSWVGCARTVASFLSSLELGSLLVPGKGEGTGILGTALETGNQGWPGSLLMGLWGHWSGMGRTEEPEVGKPYLTVKMGSAQDLGTEEDGP